MPRVGFFGTSTTGAHNNGKVPWIRHVGEGAMIIRFGTSISRDINDRVIRKMRANGKCYDKCKGCS